MNYSFIFLGIILVVLLCYLKKRNVETFESRCTECTDNLDCPVGFRCCDGKCKEQAVISQIRGDNLYVPQRMTVCPNEVTDNNKHTWISGTFEDIQMSDRMQCSNF